jgi:protein-disulfide isomerase
MYRNFRIASLPAVSLALVIYLGGCSSTQMDLENHPEWIFSAMKAHPKEFAEAMQAAQKEQQKLAREEREKAEKQQREDDMKNPKFAVVEPGRAILGDPKAPVQVVVYSDFQCPFCSRGFKTMQSVLKKYGDKISYVYKNLPLPFHPLALPAAKRYEAIVLQNPKLALKFHDLLYENQSDLSEKWMDKTAKKLGVNVAKMHTDMESKIVGDRLEADKAEATKFGFSGTPGYLVGGIAIRGAYPEEEFDKIIDSLLTKKTTGSEVPKS